jgi:hypothetical protein
MSSGRHYATCDEPGAIQVSGRMVAAAGRCPEAVLREAPMSYHVQQAYAAARRDMRTDGYIRESTRLMLLHIGYEDNNVDDLERQLEDEIILAFDRLHNEGGRNHE